MKSVAALLVFLVCVSYPAIAENFPSPSQTDSRIQWVEYDPDQVVILQGTIGYQMMVEFAAGERLENVAIGDSLAWQVTPNKLADRLFLKPLDAHTDTNLTVVTNERRYLFELRVAMEGSTLITPYVLRFNYPPTVLAMVIPPDPAKPPLEANTNYAVSGPLENRPSRVFDDGHMVYFQWPPDAEVPAIFAVSADGAESLINYTVRDGYIVVDQLSPRFVLRNGKQVMTVVNYNLFKSTAERPKPYDGLFKPTHRYQR
jgi:type IV secretion system protein VirB9